MKKTRLKRKSRSETRKVQDELWQLCRQIIMARYPEPHKCFTCHKPVDGANRHLGHFIPNSVGGALLRYNLDNLRLQCYYCNINCGGQGAMFYRNLVKEKGQNFVDNLFELKNKCSVNALEHYKKLLNEYKNL